MAKFVTAALAALVVFSAVATSAISPAEARHGRNTAIAAGVVLGIAAAAALSSNANAGQRSSWAQRCRNLYNRCVNGSNYACNKYETNGCTE